MSFLMHGIMCASFCACVTHLVLQSVADSWILLMKHILSSALAELSLSKLLMRTVTFEGLKGWFCELFADMRTKWKPQKSTMRALILSVSKRAGLVWQRLNSRTDDRPFYAAWLCAGRTWLHNTCVMSFMSVLCCGTCVMLPLLDVPQHGEVTCARKLSEMT